MTKNPWKLLLEKTHKDWVINESDMALDEPGKIKSEQDIMFNKPDEMLNEQDTLLDGSDKGMLNAQKTMADKSEIITPGDSTCRGEEITHDFFNAVSKDFNAWVPALALPGLKMISPTDLKKEAVPVPVKRVPGGGMLWGNIIHRVMEDLVKGTEDLEQAVTQAVQEFVESNESTEYSEYDKYDGYGEYGEWGESCENDNNGESNDSGVNSRRANQGERVESYEDKEIRKLKKRKNEVLDQIKRFKSTGLWKRIARSQTKLTEVPFSLKIEKGNRLYNFVTEGEDVPVIISGTIDLAFKEADGWVIVDYKSDRVEDEKGIHVLLDVYLNQVKLYALVWEEITGEKVISAEIYFVHLNESRTIYRND